MKHAIEGLLSSRKALMVLVVMISSTVLVAMGRMSSEQWESVARWLGMSWLGAQAFEDAFVKSAAIKADGNPDVTGDPP